MEPISASWGEGGGHTGQVTSSLQGWHIETNNHPHSHLWVIYIYETNDSCVITFKIIGGLQSKLETFSHDVDCFPYDERLTRETIQYILANKVKTMIYIRTRCSQCKIMTCLQFFLTWISCVNPPVTRSASTNTNGWVCWIDSVLHVQGSRSLASPLSNRAALYNRTYCGTRGICLFDDTVLYHLNCHPSKAVAASWLTSTFSTSFSSRLKQRWRSETQRSPHNNSTSPNGKNVRKWHFFPMTKTRHGRAKNRWFLLKSQD